MEGSAHVAIIVDTSLSFSEKAVVSPHSTLQGLKYGKSRVEAYPKLN